ncbi:PALP domain-containing protein [Mycena chlorophos]|uniref:L-serine ammonia-lyase n=1 Tax=Mycena chlorophos TaxID=658473 RepID=A0A8H6WMM4_MYCCL|nr:PALP domain-containing protein [Mycena chlorophos]
MASPLVRSSRLSDADVSVFLKLETVHPPMSFKWRGMSHFIRRAKEVHGPNVHAIIASGGNAGIAAAAAARVLDVRCTVLLPDWAAQATIDVLKRDNANVLVGGKDYQAVLDASRKLAEETDNGVVVPAYDDPVVWEGHSSMVMELAEQLSTKPSAIFCSVGGAGLLGGIITGCARVGWEDVQIVALETIGSDCFYHSMALNRGASPTSLPDGVTVLRDEVNNVALARFSTFSSKASGSLGASSPAAGVVKMALDRAGPVTCVTLPDELSMQAASAFADDHKLLVELACSTTLVPAYKRALLDQLVPPTTSPRHCVFIVCGGYKVSVDDVIGYRAQVAAWPRDSFEVYCDGRVIQVEK